MTRERQALGQVGESVARRYLRRQGFKILASNVRSRLGELDIVARDGSTLVFVEVRTKATGEFGRPEASVTLRKQQQVVRAAQRYLATTVRRPVACRFDVVAVTVPEGGGPPALEHIRDAFPAEGVPLF
jgi:putative endonuclease